MSRLLAILSFACGGAILLFALYLVMIAAQHPEGGIGPAGFGVTLGFLAFFLLAIGLDFILEPRAQA
jgi:small neutral amino acid transporter SnatA (MarC family)